MLLDSKTKFSITSPTRDNCVSPDHFFQWSTKNMYRTSYNDMFIKSPVEKKTYAIPKYQGFIPTKDATSQLGAGYTAVSRRCFIKEKLDDKPNLLASTGFNWKQIPKNDHTLDAWSYKYGKQTMQSPHPTIDDPMRSTTFRQSFQKPMEMPRPNSRQVASCKNLLFDPKMQESTRGKTAASGFFRAFQLCDGKTWVPEKVLHSDMVRTEYRNRFNPEKKFHKVNLMNSTGRLPKRTLTYDKN